MNGDTQKVNALNGDKLVMPMNATTSTKSRNPNPKVGLSYVNVNRQSKNYKDKYKIETDKALKKFKADMGKPEDYELTQTEWERFFKTVLIPLDNEREKIMIQMFKDNRPELNNLLILHNTKASINLAEVYFKKFQKESPNGQWYDMEDFKQMALEGLAIAADKFDLTYKNRFLTYATWWMLNRVMKPQSKMGAMVAHTSLSSPLGTAEDGGGETTLEEVLSPSGIALDYNSPSCNESRIDPAAAMDKKRVDENFDFFSTLKKMKTSSSVEGIDKNKAMEMSKYLLSIVERNEGNPTNKQIFLYLFKKIFNRCSLILQGTELANKLTPYVESAPKSKVELLSRIQMNEKQYESTCKTLMNIGYDGI